MDYYQFIKKPSYSSISSSFVKLGKEKFVLLMAPEAPLCFQYAPAGNCLATASLANGISISSLAYNWLCLGAALPQ